MADSDDDDEDHEKENVAVDSVDEEDLEVND